jgi:internalin A
MPTVCYTRGMVENSNSDERGKPRCRWYQFTPRTLLIAVAVLSVPWFGLKVRDARQEATIVAIEELGGKVVYDYDFSRPWYLGLLGDDAFRRVHAVDLSETKATDADVRRLSGLAELAELSLSFTNVTDAGLEPLAHLTNLHSLSLVHTQITDQGLKHLGKLSQLESLDLDDTQITDAGVRELTGLVRLTYLNINGDQITDYCFPYLKRLPQLKDVKLFSGHVTHAGVARLRAELPNCKIEHY